MDLLESILSGMDKPPEVKKPVIKDKEKREKLEKLQKERQEAAKKQKEIVDKFRSDISIKIKDFVNKPQDEHILELTPMSKIFRSIVHETCDEHIEELVVHSIGTEDVDRHCVIWKRGFEPSEEELRAMKLGIQYKPKTESDQEQSADEEDKSEATGETKDKFWSKYEKIIGENASGVDAARVALPAKQYGCVPIENKKDQRSIEQIMNDNRRTKKQKTSNETSLDDNVEASSSHEKQTG